ncbi:MAG TPA: DEAD/DEAH box helicase [Tepidiformaceae bacterium]
MANHSHLSSIGTRKDPPTLIFFKRKRTTSAAAESSTATLLAPAESASHPLHRPDYDPDHHHSPVPHDAAAPARSRRRRGRGRGPRPATDQPAVAVTPTPRRPDAKIAIPEAFRALGIDPAGLEAIAALGFDQPTPIQEQALPALLDGDDVVGLAQTGTGKTLAFGIPLAASIDPAANHVQSIVLVPTRELANQVRETLDHLGQFYGFRTVGLVGGRPLRADFNALTNGAQVVVGTPGRVIDHLKRGTLSVSQVHFVVLDEADQMLDIGFARDIDFILRTAPKQRQTALFSATIPESIRRLVYRYMRKAVNISVTPEQRTAEGVVQYFCEVAEREKFLALRHIYENRSFGRSLVFRRTKIGVDRLTSQLQSCGVPARAIHGDLRQGERDRVMADFRSGRLEFLIATNVASRGLDIPDIQHVINYDVPQNAEEYIHRIGRTARAGKTGAAITFVSEWELAEWDVITRSIGQAELQEMELPTRWD